MDLACEFEEKVVSPNIFSYFCFVLVYMSSAECFQSSRIQSNFLLSRKTSIKVEQNIILTRSVNACINQVSNQTAYTLPALFFRVIERASSTVEEGQIHD